MRDAAGFKLHLAGAGEEQVLGDDLNSTIQWPRGGTPLLQVRTVQVNTQQDAKEVSWMGEASVLARALDAADLTAMAGKQGAVQFDVVPGVAPTAPVLLSMECGAGCTARLDLTRVLQGLEAGKRHTLAVPLACFAARGADLRHVEVPWRISAQRPFSASFTALQVVTGAGSDGRTLSCDELN
jgi:beta-glucosidase